MEVKTKELPLSKIKPKKARKTSKNKQNKSYTNKRTGENVYIGKYEHIFNKRWTENEIKYLADELLDWMEQRNENLWTNDFFNERKITRTRVNDTFLLNEYFAKIYDICKSIQESRMFKAGTSKQTNPAMWIIGLKNNHGWTDKPERQETETENDLSFEGWN